MIYILSSGDSLPRVQKQQYHTHRSQVRFSFGRHGRRCVPSQTVFVFFLVFFFRHLDSLKHRSLLLLRGSLREGRWKESGGVGSPGDEGSLCPRPVFPVLFLCSLSSYRKRYKAFERHNVVTGLRIIGSRLDFHRRSLVARAHFPNSGL